MLYRIKVELFRIRKFVSRSQYNGLSLPYIFLIHMPRVFLLMAYKKTAKKINDRLLAVSINKYRMHKFHKKQISSLGNHFYVIVMPDTLHYLIPCLQLLPSELNVFLIFNGAKTWERRLLLSEFKHRPSFKLYTLPFSSINHGNVLNLFFHTNEKNFGIIDHDLYIFDRNIFHHLKFSDDQFMKAIFSGENRFTGMVYPHTFFLFFNAAKIKQLMYHYKVDARTYKELPRSVETSLASIGLNNNSFIKDYIRFYDTLHVLLALGYVKGWQVDYLETEDVYHLGGTSMGAQYTKDLSHMYISMRFLEFVNIPQLTDKYLPYMTPYTTSEQINQKLGVNPEVLQMRNTLETILAKLSQSLRIPAQKKSI